MFTLEVSNLAGLPALVYLANLALASVFVCGAALIAQRLWRPMPLPLRHTILACGLAVTVASPLLVGLFPLAGRSLVGVTAYEAATPTRASGNVVDQLGPEVRIVPPRATDETQPDAGVGSSAAAARNDEPGHDGTVTAGPGVVRSETATAVRIADAKAMVASRLMGWVASGLVAIWLLGSGYQLYRLCQGLRQVRRFVRSVQSVDDPRIHDLAHQAAQSVGLAAPPLLRHSAEIQSPVSLGLWLPRVVLPSGRPEQWSDEAWRAMLVHEMAHVQRRDAVVGLLQRVALVMYWWNPLVHRVSTLVSLLREEICDDLVTAHAPSGLSYATLLVELAARSVECRTPGLVLGSADGSPGELTQRVCRLMDMSRPLVTRLNARMTLAGAVFAVALIVGLAATSVPLARARMAPASNDNAVAIADAADEAVKEAPAEEPAVPMLEKVVRTVNPAGEPVAGAKVSPWAFRSKLGHGIWMKKGMGESEPPTVTTDAEGKATIPFPRYVNKNERVSPQALTCRVVHPDFAEAAYNDVSVTDKTLTQTSTIMLHPGAQLALKAVVGDRVLPMEHVYAVTSSPARLHREKMKLNAAGSLVTPRLPAGEDFLRLAYLPPDGPPMFSAIEPLALVDGQAQDLAIEMKPAVRVEGVLDSQVPRPVKNGRVVSEIIRRRPDGHSLGWWTCAPIRDDGTFTLEAVPQGDLQVIALCDGFMAESGLAPDFATADEKGPGSFHCRPQVFPLAEGKNEITLAMAPTAECVLHVLDGQGRPVAGAECAFWPNVGWWTGGSQIYGEINYSTAESLTNRKRFEQGFGNDRTFRATTDAVGRAVVKNLPPNSGSFIVMHDKWELPLDISKRRSAAADLLPGKTTDVTVRMQAKGSDYVGDVPDQESR